MYITTFALCILLSANNLLAKVPRTHDNTPFVGSFTNWATNFTFNAQAIHYPKTNQELLDLMANNDKFRIVGSLHGFSRIANTDGILISLANFTEISCCNENKVSVGAGVSYTQLQEELYKSGKAINNVPSFPHINVIGAIVTGSHGSGFKNGILATMVQDFDFVTTSGEIMTISKSNPLFYDVLVGYGYLGVVTRVSLQVEDTFDLIKCTYGPYKFEEFNKNLDLMFGDKDYVWFFVDSRKKIISSGHVMFKIDSENPMKECPSELLGAPYLENAYKVLDDSPWTMTGSGVGPAKDKLFLFSVDSSNDEPGDELSTEYFFNKENVMKALEILFAVPEEIQQIINNIEIRPMKQDKFLLSQANGHFVYGMNISFILEEERVIPLMEKLETQLLSLTTGTNFSKNFNFGPERLKKIYGRRFNKFKYLSQKLDPKRKLVNEYYREKFGNDLTFDNDL